MARSSDRFDFNLEVFKINGVKLGDTVNVSPDGIFLQTQSVHLEINEFIPIHIHPSTDEYPIVQAIAEIRWKNEKGPIGYGMRVHEKESKALGGLIKKLLLNENSA